MIFDLGLGVAGWLLISYLAAALEGWHEIASAYPVDRSQKGELVLWRRASMRAMTHELINILWGDRAMTVSAPALFRFGRPPFTIPYADISVSAGRILWFKTVRLRFGKAPGSHLDLSPRSAGGLRGLARGEHRLAADVAPFARRG